MQAQQIEKLIIKPVNLNRNIRKEGIRSLKTIIFLYKQQSNQNNPNNNIIWINKL